MPPMTTGTMTQRYWVEYEVDGLGYRLAGPYPGIMEANNELLDIVGFEGVSMAVSRGPYVGTEAEPDAMLKMMSDDQLKLVMES